MNWKRLLTLSLFLSLIVWVSAQGVFIPKSNVIEEKDGKTYYIHKVTKGQTLYSIAKTYDVSLDELYFENPGLKENGLKAGQELWIPTVNKETEVTKERAASDFDYFYHIASDNETFGQTARLYNIPERYIRLANPDLQEPFRNGEYVKIPIEASFPILDGKAGSKSYQVPDVDMASRKNQYSQQKVSNVATGKKTWTKNKNVSFDPNVKVLEDYRHVVIRGETLEDVAKKYGIKVSDLKLVNPGLTSIRQGDRLRLPDYAKIPGVKQYEKPVLAEPSSKPGKLHEKSEQEGSKYYRYTVKKGDNLFKVSKKFGVAIDDLYDANPGLFSEKLKAGTVILIPKLKKRPKYVYYKVPFKTKLKKVAQLYGVSKEVLKKDNPELRNKLLPGQVVKIRGGEEAVLLNERPEKETSSYHKNVQKKHSKKKSCIPSPDKNKRYRVALMVPLFLEEMQEVDYENFHHSFQAGFKPFWFIKFLEGALVAIDSLRAEGYQLDISVYDVDDQITKTVKTLQRPEMKDMDLIIGPFYSKSFDQVAIFASNYEIPVVNPFTFKEDMLDKYQNIIKVKPGADAQIPLLKILIDRYYKNYKIFVVSQNAFKNADRVNAVRKVVQETVEPEIYLSNLKINNLSIEVMNRQLNEEEGITRENVDPVSFKLEGKWINPVSLSEHLFDSTLIKNQVVYVNYMKDSIHPVAKLASPLRKNLVVVYGNNKAFVTDVMNRLNVLKDTFDIQVIGMPYWEQIKRPDYQLFNNLELTYFSSVYIDRDDEAVQAFIKRFNHTYLIDPDEYAFAGFDITWFFVKALADYQKDFKKCLPELNAMMFENGFSFKPAGASNKNFENTMWNILQINNYKVRRLPESDLIPNEIP